MTNHKHTNRLIHETSPYLLQHAHNPVDWFPWCEEAFAKAKEEDKPIIVSIGYSTCHWCHVMERESFEDETVANFMNEHFVNIKVDREERPDVDQIYMEAIQILTGSGGWPLNCFLTPDKRPFYGGTYFPPQPAYNRASWIQVLNSIHQTYVQKREVVNKQADRLTDSISKTDTMLINRLSQQGEDDGAFSPAQLENIYYKLRETFDRVEGGFGNAPKFPGTMSLVFLLKYFRVTGNQEALDHALLSLDKMIMGGIYDQLGGGFARYATDREWLVPHFEKMLYDNALLVRLLADAYKLTQKPLYENTIRDTLAYVLREMTNEGGGFYSAQDADSEGVEGKFFVWSNEEIINVVGKETGELFCSFYGVEDGGNWEGYNILWRPQTLEKFAVELGLEAPELAKKFENAREKLFEVRDKRIKPGLDDKLLLNWNALMCAAFANAYEALGEEAYREAAIRSMDYMLENFGANESHGLKHTFKNGKAKYAAFLDDYAFLIDALISIFELTQEPGYLNRAKGLTDYVIDNFLDSEQGLFYFTSGGSSDILIRRKDIYDNAIPSGNAYMVNNLQRLSILVGKTAYKELALQMLSNVKMAVERYPSSFSQWAQAYLDVVHPIPEIAVVGPEALNLSREISRLFLSNRVIMQWTKDNAQFPLVAEKEPGEETLIFVCRDYACMLPVDNIEDMKAQLSLN